MHSPLRNSQSTHGYLISLTECLLSEHYSLIAPDVSIEHSSSFMLIIIISSLSSCMPEGEPIFSNSVAVSFVSLSFTEGIWIL